MVVECWVVGLLCLLYIYVYIYELVLVVAMRFHQLNLYTIVVQKNVPRVQLKLHWCAEHLS